MTIQAIDGVLQQLQTASLQASNKSSETSNQVDFGATMKAALDKIDAGLGQRRSRYAQRADKQGARLNLPAFPTTTIGSFPQTTEIRHARSQFKAGQIDEVVYNAAMRREIAHSVREQEKLGLDVLVHGEAERNDMVEYFGEQLDGYAFSQFGWVQSYGFTQREP